MRRILLKNINTGMKLAKPLYNGDGSVVLNAGIELNKRFISQLKELAVTYVYVEDMVTQDIDIPDVISEKIRVESVVATKLLIEQIKLGKGVAVAQAKKIVQSIIHELQQNHSIMLNFIDMRTQQDYLFSHAVNVCVLSIMTGISLALEQELLCELGVGALLHDVGKIDLSSEIANKKGRLTPVEKSEIKKHPTVGFDIVRKNDDISFVSAQCVLQHHERYNGSGYPLGLHREEIHQCAQIVGIADVFDALTSDATYRQAMTVYEALALLIKAGGVTFDYELVNKFAQNIAIYPIGSVVRLNNNQIGVVVDISREYKAKPVVRIVMDENREKVHKILEIDLSKNPRLYIANVEER